MKRYSFRLAQVQRIRRIQEDLAVAALGTAQRAEALAAEVEAARVAAMADRARPEGVTPGADLIAARVVWDAELQSYEIAVAEHASATLERAARRDAWLAAAQRVQALDLLDDRRREEHRIETDREIAAAVDDLSGGRHHRRALEEAS